MRLGTSRKHCGIPDCALRGMRGTIVFDRAAWACAGESVAAIRADSRGLRGLCCGSGRPGGASPMTDAIEAPASTWRSKIVGVAAAPIRPRHAPSAA
jgi:hypothetical protein